MRTYKQLNLAQRYQIEILKKAGKQNKEVATLIETSAGTISRELTRNGGVCVQAQAQTAREKADQDDCASHPADTQRATL